MNRPRGESPIPLSSLELSIHQIADLQETGTDGGSPELSTQVNEGINTEPTMDAAVKRVLCVDLDGTLVATDLLWESLLSAIRTRPWVLLQAPLWLLRARADLARAELAAVTHGIPLACREMLGDPGESRVAPAADARGD